MEDEVVSGAEENDSENQPLIVRWHGENTFCGDARLRRWGIDSERLLASRKIQFVRRILISLTAVPVIAFPWLPVSLNFALLGVSAAAQCFGIAYSIDVI